MKKVSNSFRSYTANSRVVSNTNFIYLNAIWTAAAYIHLMFFSTPSNIPVSYQDHFILNKKELSLISILYNFYVQGVTKRVAPSLTNLSPLIRLFSKQLLSFDGHSVLLPHNKQLTLD